MIILVGPSASGKTSVAKTLIEKYNFQKLVTYTTRSPRLMEVDGVDYHFCSKEEFLKKQNNNEFIETTLYNNNYYGTAFSDLKDNKVLIVDINGANNYYEYLKGTEIAKKTIYAYTYCDRKEVIRRMRLRGDKEEDIRRRLRGDDEFFDRSKMKHIDILIDTTHESIDRVCEIIVNIYRKISGE